MTTTEFLLVISVFLNIIFIIKMMPTKTKLSNYDIEELKKGDKIEVTLNGGVYECMVIYNNPNLSMITLHCDSEPYLCGPWSYLNDIFENHTTA